MTASCGCSAPRKAIPMLLDSPRIKSLLASLPADAERDDLQATYLKRERQYRELRNRAVQIRERCAAIAQTLPDATTKDRKALQDERRDLLAEQAALPADLTAAARLFAESLADWSGATFAAIDREHARGAVRLNATEDGYRAAEYALRQFAPDTISEAYDQAYGTVRKMAEQRKPMIDRMHDLRQLQEFIARFVKDALGAEGDSTKVKLVDGRPIEFHVARFVGAAAQAAA